MLKYYYNTKHMEIPYSGCLQWLIPTLSLNKIKIKIKYRFPLLVVPGFPPSM
jgi:hypothetical protein